MLGIMYRWYVAAFSSGLYTRRPGSVRPHSAEARQDRRIVWAAAAARTASREEIRAHVAPAVSPSIIGNRLLASGLRAQIISDHVCLWPGYHLHYDTTKHGYSGVVNESTGEWTGALLSSVIKSRFCLYANDGRTSIRRRQDERHLPECIRPRYTGPTSGCMVCGATSYNSRSHLVFLQGRVNSARYISHNFPTFNIEGIYSQYSRRGLDNARMSETMVAL